MKPEYVETRVLCPYCGNLNEPADDMPCAMCGYWDPERTDTGRVMEEGRTTKPWELDATPERPLRRHLDDRSTPTGCSDADQPADVDGWPVPGCISPA